MNQKKSNTTATLSPEEKERYRRQMILPGWGELRVHRRGRRIGQSGCAVHGGRGSRHLEDL
jgi:hypothetical protein